MLELKMVKINKPPDLNFILGQSHFIKTVEDLYEVLVNNVPGIKFGLAFAEASGACKIRSEGNDPFLVDLACKNMLELGCGHSFIVFLKRIKVLTKVVKGITTKYGIVTRATVSKNHLSQKETSIHQVDFQVTAKGSVLIAEGAKDDEDESDDE